VERVPGTETEGAGKEAGDVAAAQQQEVAPGLSPPICAQIVEGLPTPLVVVDRQYTFRAANAAYLRFRAAARAEVIGRPVEEVTGAETFARIIRPEIDRALAGMVTTVQAWVDYAGAGRRYIEVHHYPLRSGERIEFAAALIRDLTARKRAETSLARYQALFEHARDTILFVAPESGRILEANEAAAHSYGYSREELLSLTIYDLRAPETARLVPQQMALATTTGILFETVHRRKDGSIFPVEVSSVATPWDGGTALLSIVRDITERRRAEEALRQRESEFHRVLESLPDIITRFDRDLRYIFVSPNVERISGTPPSAFIGKTPRETGLFDEEALERSTIYSRRAFETGQVQTFEHRVLAGGRTFYYSVRVIPEFDERGQVVSLLNISQDVTERKQAELERERLLEAERRARAQAEAALRLRDEFLAVAAHELKTPLTSLRGQAELTIRRIERRGVADPEQVRRALEVIRLQVGRLSNLVVRLLDISRLEGGELELERQTVDLVPLVRSVVETMQAETRRHALTLRAPATLTAMVDPQRLQEVLYNLIDNAIRYSPRGGPVEVELAEAGPGRVRIAVRDYGMGVAPEKRAQLFTRYFQAAARPVGGLGLGLYISRRIVELHGGRIWAEFPEDGGSRFVVELPTGVV